MKWHPIETAPTTIAEIVDANHANGHMCKGTLMIARADRPCTTGPGMMPGYAGECEWIDGAWAQAHGPTGREMFNQDYSIIADPTHWALIPPLPGFKNEDQST